MLERSPSPAAVDVTQPTPSTPPSPAANPDLDSLTPFDPEDGRTLDETIEGAADTDTEVIAGQSEGDDMDDNEDDNPAHAQSGVRAKKFVHRHVSVPNPKYGCVEGVGRGAFDLGTLTLSLNPLHPLA